MVSFQEDENGILKETEEYKQNIEILIWCYVSMRDVTINQYKNSGKLSINYNEFL